MVGVALLLGALVFWRYSQIPAFGPFEIRGIVAGTMTLALLAMAQSVIVISGGIDLSVGAMMVLANCIAARLMLDQDLGPVVLIALLVVAVAMVLSGLIGAVAVVSGVPDIVVTLAASFILSGLALIVLDSPGGGTHRASRSCWSAGSTSRCRRSCGWPPSCWSGCRSSAAASASPPTPSAATGPPPSCPASRVGRTRVIAYVLAGFFSGLAGVVTTAFTGSGEPRASIGATATLTSVAAVVLGGVALLGGSGTLLGPVLAALCLGLIPALMLGLGWDPNYAEVARGVIIIVVVMVGGLVRSREVAVSAATADPAITRWRRRWSTARPSPSAASWWSCTSSPGWSPRACSAPTASARPCCSPARWPSWPPARRCAC